MLQIPLGIGSAGVGTAQEGFRSCSASHRDATGRRDHPETAPRGFRGILGWRGGAEPSSDAGCRANSRVVQTPLLPVIPAPKWVSLTGLPQAVLGHRSCLRSAGLGFARAPHLRLRKSWFPPRAPQRCISVWCPSFLGRPSLAGRNLFCISNLLW